jgi:L-ascorbate metabolism protein UlaG (beta-lactamase superfamily)
MRLKLRRPDLERYRHLFTVPAATDTSPLSVTWLGVATVLIDDGTSALLTDGFFSRPALPTVALRAIAPNPARVDGCLARARVRRLEAVIPVHTHFDHALDSALVAQRTGALLVGGESAANIGRGHGLPEDRILLARSGEPIRLAPTRSP